MQYAHTKDGLGPEHWEPLEEHLRDVARLAGAFAEAIGAERWGQLAGWWHDVGKYSAAFQRYLHAAGGGEAHLEEQPGRVDHSTVGAQHAWRTLGEPAGTLLAYCIAGHHAGLPDAETESDGSLAVRLRKAIEPIEQAPQQVLQQQPPSLPELAWATDDKGRAFQAAVFCRMLFSCLVDADFLATEAFMAPERGEGRVVARRPAMGDLEAEVLAAIERKAAGAEPTGVNEHRQGILRACLQAAEREPGLFSLTVPTGGGKTLASLALGLRHARLHGLRRVIYAIPFTSIIEQNADVFREALGQRGDLVLEHHSNLDPARESRWSRLAAENWDAPVVVTTNVQLLESLFAARSGRCRKLHRIAGSVIVLDEVQTLPVDLLEPSLAVLRELSRNYGCTIVLCSATQPAVAEREDFTIGLSGVREIIDDRSALFDALKRVTVQHEGRLSDADLVDGLAEQPQVLCIVNTRRHAAELYGQLTERRDAIHLSANMCPAHRSAIVADICERLRAGEPCAVISTQLIEAGVDVDFPVVYRAMAGLDSVAQAAGRCNREGRRARGQVYLFEPEQPIPPGPLRQTADTTAELLGRFDDLLSVEAIEAYFGLHYWKRKADWDRHEVMRCFRSGGRTLDFREAEERYRLIRQEQKPIIVPWGKRGRELVDQLRRPTPPGRDLSRAVQRYIVQIPEHVWTGLLQADGEVLHERFAVLANERMYDERLGLMVEESGVWNPEAFIG